MQTFLILLKKMFLFPLAALKTTIPDHGLNLYFLDFNSQNTSLKTQKEKYNKSGNP